MYVVIRFYPWLKFYFSLFQIYYLILHYFYPKIKENIIQTKYTFEPQLVRGQKRAFEMREIHECKAASPNLYSSKRPKSASFNSHWIRISLKLVTASRRVVFHLPANFSCEMFASIIYNPGFPKMYKELRALPKMFRRLPKVPKRRLRLLKTVKDGKDQRMKH